MKVGRTTEEEQDVEACQLYEAADGLRGEGRVQGGGPVQRGRVEAEEPRDDGGRLRVPRPPPRRGLLGAAFFLKE